MSTTTAAFVGDGTLLVRCAQTWQDAGHAVVLVVSRNREVLDWAQSAGIPHASFDARDSAAWGDVQFDYLFSVAHLQVLPADVIARAGKLAINFHDGPLPRYAGLHATSWALMAGESMHGVTWHEMTTAVDAGRIVRQVLFPLAAQETALSLNARCYEAGLASFAEIARAVALGDLTAQLRPQAGERSWFGRDRRPDALGTLDFTRSAQELAALVRSLDFGPYPNPLGRAKVDVGDRLILVRQARVLDTATLAEPGTVLRAEPDALQVACGDGDLLLTGLTCVRGEPLTEPVRCARLPLPDAETRARLAACTPHVAHGEPHWIEALSQLAPVTVPHPRKHAAVPSGMEVMDRVPMASHVAGAEWIAGVMGWLAALTGQERVSVLYSDSYIARQALGVEKWLCAWVPLTLTARADTLPADLVRDAQTQVEAARRAGPYPCDLPARLGERQAPPPLRVALALHRTTMPEGVDLLVVAHNGHPMELVASETVFAPATLERMAAQLGAWLTAFTSSARPLAQLPLQPAEEALALAACDGPDVLLGGPAAAHEAIALQAARTPDRIALQGFGEALTHAQLESRATALAVRLVQRGVRPGDIVGLCLERSPELVIAMLAAWKAGAAYLPLDPDYPRERIAFMTADSGVATVLTTGELARTMSIPAEQACLVDASSDAAPATVDLPAPDAQRAAYVIYTSGSTGQPKGVVVTHANVMNFFAGMDPRIARASPAEDEPPGRWLAVTSLSFDISVLELAWTLARGFTVVLHAHTVRVRRSAPEFSLFYFASDHPSTPQDRYRLLMEGTKYADAHGFSAVWTPERHFHAFGGLYPNPAVTSAALAAATTRVQIRAGSCVLPLHHPIRVAEEWAFVDNISQGRVGLSVAAGWQPNDFVIAPANFADRKASMLANIDVVRRLWRGERLPFPGPDGKPVEVQTLPRPVQPELPIWLTAAGNPETFQQAGTLGCHLLTHLLGQTVEDVADKVRIYREAWRAAGHPGHGNVTLMLHTFVGDDEDEVRETVRQPMKEYLRSAVDLVRKAAWTFPTFVQRGAEHGKSPVEIMESQPLTEDELDALLEHAFERYYGTSALFGTRERCLAMVEKLRDADVDEIACLVDFGIPTQTVLDHLEDLKELMDAARDLRPAVQRVSVAQQIVDHGITHLQCTPSMAGMLVADSDGRAALARLASLMVGGEALPLPLARELRALVPGQLLNMYGPTETTIWSTVCDLREIGEFVPLGDAIANTRVAVRTPWGVDCPALVPGELCIGGAGVARGYLGRPELTAERFVTDAEGQRWYRTGDLVRRHPDGTLEFLGRMDHQVKIRGHRIELGEIESALQRQSGVTGAVAMVRDDAAGEKRLLAYVTPAAGATLDASRLREALAAALPEALVPQAIVVLPAFPLTPNGKVDRRALPGLETIVPTNTGPAPQGELETAIATIWKEVLGLSEVGTTDNFFDLGGHSLAVVQVQRRLREELGREVAITDMFRLPTIRALADHLGGKASGTSAVGDGVQRAQARRMRARHGAAAAGTPLA